MAWKNLYENDQLSIKFDTEHRNLIMETSGGGLIPSYVTLFLQEKDVDELIEVLNSSKKCFNT